MLRSSTILDEWSDASERHMMDGGVPIPNAVDPHAHTRAIEAFARAIEERTLQQLRRRAAQKPGGWILLDELRELIAKVASERRRIEGEG